MKKIISLFIIVSLGCLGLHCTDFLSGPKLDTSPNQAVEVPIDNLFAGIQVAMYTLLEGPGSSIGIMWMQQMAGVAQHYDGYDKFLVNADNFTGSWSDIYTGGGLTDMKKLKSKAAEADKYLIVGITKMWEAYIMSFAADYWGDVPYSEACDPEIEIPKYDKQSAVHDAVLTLLDGAIADLQKGQEYFDGSWDFTYDGDADKWIAAAHSLKARILLNWAEVRNGNYALALTEAQQGISSEADNWKTWNGSKSGEENIWWQFETYRFGYIRVGNLLVELLKSTNDPRVEIYFGKDVDGGYSGSKSGEGLEGASWLNTATYGNKSWDTELLTWAETQFIIAECQYNTGDEPGALSTLNNIQAGLEAKWGLDANSLPRYSGLSGVNLLKAIMEEKYKALFLNLQVWSDWRRTGFPVFTHTHENRGVPRRYLYSDDELNTNPNCPTGIGILDRVENDPGDPAYLSKFK